VGGGTSAGWAVTTGQSPSVTLHTAAGAGATHLPHETPVGWAGAFCDGGSSPLLRCCCAVKERKERRPHTPSTSSATSVHGGLLTPISNAQTLRAVLS
jgi:hypothetical protein